MSFCMLCTVAFCQSVLLKRDDDDDDAVYWTFYQPSENRDVYTEPLRTSATVITFCYKTCVWADKNVAELK